MVQVGQPEMQAAACPAGLACACQPRGANGCGLHAWSCAPATAAAPADILGEAGNQMMHLQGNNTPDASSRCSEWKAMLRNLVSSDSWPCVRLSRL